jgi:hypothetical protein
MWRDFVTANVLFDRMPYIRERYNFVETNNAPYYLYWYAANRKRIPKGAIKIEIPVENKYPNMKACDWAFSVKYGDEINDKRHMRLPTYTRLGAGTNLIKGAKYNPQSILKQKTKFCAFVFWNASAKFRKNFFHELSKYKRVDAPGRACNNMRTISGHKNWNAVYNHIHGSAGSLNRDIEKVQFLKQYKFCISFANESSVGYTSEKIYHSMLANCIPIYWGNPLIHRDFNPKSFLNYHDDNSVSTLIDRIIALDKDDDLYLEYLKQPWLPGNKLTPWLNPKAYINRFREIFGP